MPQVATAQVDGRFLPGHEEEFFAEIDALIGPGVKREQVHHDIAVETTFDGDLVAAMAAALLAEDPDGADGAVLPVRRHRRQVLLPAGHPLLRLRPAPAAAELDFAGMFHGVDERVPVAALQFGVRVLDNFLDLC